MAPDDVAFAALKAGMDSLPVGAKMFLNSGANINHLSDCTPLHLNFGSVYPGQFYGPDRGPHNVDLVSRFFEKYPEYVDKAFLSVKGGVRPGGGFDPTYAFLRWPFSVFT